MTDRDERPEAIAGEVLRVLGSATNHPMVVVEPTALDGEIDALVVWANDVAQRLHSVVEGRMLREILGTGVGEFPAARAGRDAFAAPGEEIAFGPIELPLDGELRSYMGTARAVGRLLVLGYHDVTAEVRAAERAARTQAEFQTVLDGLDAGVILHRPILDGDRIVDAEIIWVNQSSHVLWSDGEGLSPGTRVADKYYDAADWLRSANSAWHGTPHTRMLTPNDSRARWTAATEKLQRIGDLLLEMTIDRSDDTELLTRLTDADLRFEALVADLPSSVFVGRWTIDELDFVSPNATQLLRVPAASVRRISDLFALVVHESRPTVDMVTQWFEGGGTHFETDWHVVRGDGTRIVASVRAVRRPMPGIDDGFIAIVSDVTEQRQYLADIAADERMRSLGRAAGSIAHDFNNLLMIIGGNIERARRFTQGDNAPLEAAATATRRATDLAQSMLAFARGRPGEPAEIRVDASLRRLEPIIKATLPSKARFTLSLDDDLPAVSADATHLEQVILNLITNARDAIEPSGSVSIEVGISDRARCHLRDEPAPGRWVEIRVVDDGSGVPADLLGLIWEPYATAKPRSNESGAGLGLSTVHGLVHQYGGHVVLDSEAGRGTSVHVYLPAFGGA